MKTLVEGITADANKQNQFVTLLGEILERYSDPIQQSPDEGTISVSKRAKEPNGGAKLLRSFGAPRKAKPTPGAGGGASIGGVGGNPALRQAIGGPLGWEICSAASKPGVASFESGHVLHDERPRRQRSVAMRSTQCSREFRSIHPRA